MTKKEKVNFVIKTLNNLYPLYLKEYYKDEPLFNEHHKLQHITSIERILEDEFVWMDKFTIRNLELYHSKVL